MSSADPTPSTVAGEVVSAAAEPEGATSSDEPPSRTGGASAPLAAPLVYKVVETSTVTDEALEGLINEWVGQGWTFDGIQFAMRESSKRPAMAFLLFTRLAGGGTDRAGAR